MYKEEERNGRIFRFYLPEQHHMLVETDDP